MYGFFSGTIIKLATLAPIWTKVSCVLISGLALFEIALPTIRGDFNEQGPLTNYYLNNYEYNDLTCPIETRADANYEFAWHGYEEDIKRGFRNENPLPKRTQPIRKLSDCINTF